MRRDAATTCLPIPEDINTSYLQFDGVGAPCCRMPCIDEFVRPLHCGHSQSLPVPMLALQEAYTRIEREDCAAIGTSIFRNAERGISCKM